jgi:hypothetical protein
MMCTYLAFPWIYSWGYEVEDDDLRGRQYLLQTAKRVANAGVLIGAVCSRTLRVSHNHGEYFVHICGNGSLQEDIRGYWWKEKD